MPSFRVVRGTESEPYTEYVEAVSYHTSEGVLVFELADYPRAEDFYSIRNWLEVGPDKR